jgi:hypothetical protein
MGSYDHFYNHIETDLEENYAITCDSFRNELFLCSFFVLIADAITLLNSDRMAFFFPSLSYLLEFGNALRLRHTNTIPVIYQINLLRILP